MVWVCFHVASTVLDSGGPGLCTYEQKGSLCREALAKITIL